MICDGEERRRLLRGTTGTGTVIPRRSGGHGYCNSNSQSWTESWISRLVLVGLPIAVGLLLLSNLSRAFSSSLFPASMDLPAGTDVNSNSNSKSNSGTFVNHPHDGRGDDYHENKRSNLQLTVNVTSTRHTPDHHTLLRLVELSQQIVNISGEPVDDHAGVSASVIGYDSHNMTVSELEEELYTLVKKANLAYLLSGTSSSSSVGSDEISHSTAIPVGPNSTLGGFDSSFHSHSYPSIRILENILGVRIYRKSSNTSRKNRQKTFSHFLSHIPKSGTSFAFGLLCDLLWNQVDYFQLDPSDRFRPCSVGTAQPSTFDSTWRGQTKKHVCNLWMSEAAWTPRAKYNMIMLRQPSHHVLSQFFHCTESREHGKHAERMKLTTNLTEWLRAWTRAIDDETQTRINQERFHCYHPVNLQSTFVFPKNTMTGTDSRTNLTALFDHLYSNSTDGGDRQSSILSTFRESIYHDLQNRFVVVGDTTQMTVSVCLMFIHYTNWIPESCDCSRRENAGKGSLDESSNENKTKTGEQKDQTLQEDANVNANVNVLQQEQLHSNSTVALRAYDPLADSHGVVHHGASYPTTHEEDELIHQLTLIDQLLYDVGRDLLQHQIEVVEDMYHIELCRSF